MTKTTIVSKSKEQTQEIARQFVKKLNTKNVIALHGDLGSGKTTFVQGLAIGLGIEQRLISPTFIIVRSYKINIGAFKLFYHIDLYRIEKEDDIKDLGIEEIVDNDQAIVAIEWAEKMKDLLPKKRWDIEFEYFSEHERKITIKGY